jgi:hypothetical protein
MSVWSVVSIATASSRLSGLGRQFSDALFELEDTSGTYGSRPWWDRRLAIAGDRDGLVGISLLVVPAILRMASRPSIGSLYTFPVSNRYGALRKG